jgi:hypothetical protein
MAKDKRRYTPSPEAARALAALNPLRKIMDDPNFAALCKQQEGRQVLAEKLSEGLLRTLGRQPNPIAPRKKGSRKQQLIQQITEEEFPGGHDQIPTNEIIHRVGEVLKRQGCPIPGRDTFNRALGRRPN